MKDINAATAHAKPNKVSTKITPKTSNSTPPAMLTMMAWTMRTEIAAVLTRIPRETPVTQAKASTGPAEKKRKLDRKI